MNNKNKEEINELNNDLLWIDIENKSELDRDNKISLLNTIMWIIHSENLIWFEVDIEQFLNQKNTIKSYYPEFKNTNNKKLLEKLIYSYIWKIDKIPKNFIEKLNIFIYH